MSHERKHNLTKSDKYNTPYDRDMAYRAHNRRINPPKHHSNIAWVIVMSPFVAAGFTVALPMGLAMVGTLGIILASNKLP